jgi:hypothetical protein
MVCVVRNPAIRADIVRFAVDKIGIVHLAGAAAVEKHYVAGLIASGISKAAPDDSGRVAVVTNPASLSRSPAVKDCRGRNIKRGTKSNINGATARGCLGFKETIGHFEAREGRVVEPDILTAIIALEERTERR